jgi:hypothetical protein
MLATKVRLRGALPSVVERLYRVWVGTPQRQSLALGLELLAAAAGKDTADLKEAIADYCGDGGGNARKGSSR